MAGRVGHTGKWARGRRAWRGSLGLATLFSLFLSTTHAQPPSDKELAAGAFAEVLRDGNLVAFTWQQPAVVAPIVRVQVQVPDLSPADLFAVAWDVGSQSRWAPHLKRLDILSAQPDELLLYEQIAVPVVKNRDYVVRLRVTQRGDGAGGSFRIDANAASDASRPVDSGYVRMTDLWSRFLFVPRAGGGCELTYDAFGDPAGAIPGWLKRSGSVRGPADFVRALVEETRRRRRAGAR